MQINYTPKVAKEIKARFHQKGWNFYPGGEGCLNEEETILKGPTTKLQRNVPYVLLPLAKNPMNPAEVGRIFDELATRLNRQMPTITVNGRGHPLTGITLEKESVHVHTPDCLRVPYEKFIESLDSIVQV
ncbi:MAG: hypothetical protein AABX79_01385 [Nanoarchaeota archaeon]